MRARPNEARLLAAWGSEVASSLRSRAAIIVEHGSRELRR